MSHPARTLDDYLSDIINHSIKQDLEHLGYSDILGFFNAFYRWVEMVEQGKPSEAIKEIESWNLPGGVTVLIVYHLKERFHHFHFPETPEPESSAPAGSVMYLDGEYERLKQSHPPDLYAQNDPSEESRLARQVLIGHYIAKDAMDLILKRAIAEGEKEAAIEMRARQSEREQIQATVDETIQAAIAAAGVKRNPEFTLNRQVLALGYILKHLGVKNIDKTAQADFVEFLINKTNKDIYDTLRELDDRLLHKEGQDAEYVAARFRKLGLETLADEIENTLRQKRGM